MPVPAQGLGWQLGALGGSPGPHCPTGLQSPPAHTGSCAGLSPCPAGLSSCSSRASPGLKLAVEARLGSREWSPDPTAADRVSPLPTTGLAATGADSRSWPPCCQPHRQPHPGPASPAARAARPQGWARRIPLQGAQEGLWDGGTRCCSSHHWARAQPSVPGHTAAPGQAGMGSAPRAGPVAVAVELSWAQAMPRGARAEAKG